MTEPLSRLEEIIIMTENLACVAKHKDRKKHKSEKARMHARLMYNLADQANTAAGMLEVNMTVEMAGGYISVLAYAIEEIYQTDDTNIGDLASEIYSMVVHNAEVSSIVQNNKTQLVRLAELLE